MKLNRMSAIVHLMAIVWTAEAAPLTWNGSTGHWTNETNWGGTVPQAGDSVVFPVGTYTVVLDSMTPVLDAYTQEGGTLLFTNWDTCLRATTVLINSGRLDHAQCNTNSAPGITNRVYLSGSTITLESNGVINVNAKGFPGAVVVNTVGQGPGGGYGNSNDQGGGGHGGVGGTAATVPGGPANDSLEAPILPGSGGGRDSGGVGGGAGGGVVRLESTGRVTVNGTITANGKSVAFADGAAGAGGSIWISCDTITGTGLLSASGGIGSSYRGGGGGGGRIAVTYDPSSQAGSGLAPSIQVSVGGGVGGSYSSVPAGAQPGTLYLTDAQILPARWPGGARIHFGPEVTALSKSFTEMHVQDGAVSFPDFPVTLSVTGDMVVMGLYNRLPYPDGIAFGTNTTLHIGGNLVLSNAVVSMGTNLVADGSMRMETDSILTVNAISNQPCFLAIGGDLILTNRCKLYVIAADTTEHHPEYGARVDIAGDLTIISNSWVCPGVWTNDNTNMTLGPVLFRVNNLMISSNAGFIAAPGYAGGKSNEFMRHGLGWGGGYSANGKAGGGGYGGPGGFFYAAGSYGQPHGSATNSNRHGSGGAMQADSRRWTHSVGVGGGVIWIQAAGDVMMDGTLAADSYGTANYNGGGSGGGILVQAEGDFSGAPGAVLRARGGDAIAYNTGGGGGGRVAVWSRMSPDLRDALYRGDVVDNRFVTSLAIPEYAGTASALGGAGAASGAPGTVLFLTGIPPQGTLIMVR